MNNAIAVTASPAFPAPGVHVIALRASDDENETGSIVTATIDAVGFNDAPRLVVGSLVQHPLGSSRTQSVFGFAVFDAGPTVAPAIRSAIVVRRDDIDTRGLALTARIA